MAVVGSPYNAFGYDPRGVIAHLCHHFFGPEWRPTTSTHLRGLQFSPTGQPRYGPPAPSQTQYLPSSFTPRQPPLYLGPPTPPYVDAPSVFDPEIFVCYRDIPSPRQNEDPSAAPCYQQWHGTEVMNGVYRMDIHFVADAHKCRPLSITTNTTLKSLHSQVRQHLHMEDEHLSLVCSIQDPFDTDNCSDSKLLCEERDWEDIVGVIKQAFSVQRDELMVTIDVLHRTPTDGTAKTISPKEDVETSCQDTEQIITDFLDLETFCFEYPPLAVLNGRQPSRSILNTHEYNLVIRAGIEYLDDFQLMSAAQLQIWTGVPMTKIQELYREARQMIDDFHAEKKGEIEEIREFTRAAQTTEASGYCC